MGTQTNNAMRGTDVQCRFFTTGKKEIILDHLSFEISENASTGSDDVCGQKRGDPYSVTNYFEMDFQGRQKDLTFLADMISNIAAKDANTGENPAVLEFTATTKLGVTTAYVFMGVTRKPFKMSADGRPSPFKMGAGFFAKDFKAT